MVAILDGQNVGQKLQALAVININTLEEGSQ